MSVLQMSISVGLLVITIMLIRFIALNRLPKKMFLALWGLALFRLLVPVSIPLPFSVPSIISEISRIALTNTAIPSVMEKIFFLGSPSTEITEATGIFEKIKETAQVKIFSITLTTIIWLLGMLAVFIFFAVIYYSNHKEMRFATLICDNDYFNKWLTENKLIRSIAIMQSDRIISPLAVGILKPRIILPKSMDMSNKQLLDYVLAHEYYHIKRYDAFWKMLLILALCVHWFNPIVWVMFVLASRDLELTCDEMVIRRFGAEAKTAYAYMLIGMIEQGSKFAPLYSGFSKNATQERIVSIMKNKKLTLARLMLALIIVSTLTIGVLVASANNSDKETPAAEIIDGNATDLFATENDTPILSFASPEKPEVIHGLTDEEAEFRDLRSKEDILITYPNIDPKILAVVFAEQANGDVWRLLSVRQIGRASCRERV